MRRLRQDLSALFGAMGPPAVSTLVCWACAAIAYRAYPLASRGGYTGAIRAAFVFCLPVLFLAYWLGAGALVFAADARRSYLPGAQRLARHASFPASVLLLPALALPVVALTGTPVGWGWAPTLLVLVIALAAVLAPLRPVAATGAFVLVGLALYWAASGRIAQGRDTELSFALLSAVLALPAVAKWRRVTRQGSSTPSFSERLRTIVFRIGPTARTRRQPAAGYASPGSLPAARIIRTCLGGMFAQLSAWPLIAGTVLLALMIALAIGLQWPGATGWRWVISSLALTAAGLVAAGFNAQLSNLTHAQLAELALMPGLGDPAEQRRALCSAVLTRPFLSLGIVLLLGATALLLKATSLSSLSALAICILIIFVTYTFLALEKLLTLPPKRNSFIAEWVRLYSFVFWVYPSWSLSPSVRFFQAHWWMWSIPVVFGVVVAGVIWYSVRRLAAAPHPFLARAPFPR